jgi:hypothetical protein
MLSSLVVVFSDRDVRAAGRYTISMVDVGPHGDSIGSKFSLFTKFSLCNILQLQNKYLHRLALDNSICCAC